MDEPEGRGVMIAAELPSPGAVDELYAELTRGGITFFGPPKAYPWTAHAAYFPGPCGEFWELYAWLGDGEPGSVA